MPYNLKYIGPRISFKIIDSALGFERAKEGRRYLLDLETSQLDGLTVCVDGREYTAICAQTDKETREAILPYKIATPASYLDDQHRDWEFFPETFNTLEAAILFSYTGCEKLFIDND